MLKIQKIIIELELWMETVCPIACRSRLSNCLFTCVVDALISKYHHIVTFHLKALRRWLTQCCHLAAATVKTNLMIIQVMFFGIQAHLPTNFDGICSNLQTSLVSNIFRANHTIRVCHYSTWSKSKNSVKTEHCFDKCNKSQVDLIAGKMMTPPQWYQRPPSTCKSVTMRLLHMTAILSFDIEVMQ